MPKHEPTSAEYQQLLDENDTLRIENVQLRRELKNKDQTIDHLQLARQNQTNGATSRPDL